MTEERLQQVKSQMLDLAKSLDLHVDHARISECQTAFELSLALELLYNANGQNWRWQDTPRYLLWDLEKLLASQDERAGRISAKALTT